MNEKDAQQTWRDTIVAAVKEKRYVKVQYFSDIHEFLTLTAVVKHMIKSREEEILILASGEEIPVDRIVRLDEEVAPQYDNIMDFTCDC